MLYHEKMVVLFKNARVLLKKVAIHIKLEFKAGHCNNINACLIKAAGGKWNFRYNVSNNSNDDEAKTHRVLKSRISYYIDYFRIGSCSKDEILGKFLSESQKYDENLVSAYYEQLKIQLES